MKSKLKDIFFGSLSAVAPLAKTYNRDRLVIIYYHRVVGKDEIRDLGDKNMCTEIGSFESQMQFLAEQYTPIGEREILSALDGKKAVPVHPVWVTFDDGYKDNFVYAYPILRKYQIPATFFITTGFINKTVFPSGEGGWAHEDGLFMSWDAICELRRSGYRIGCHTVNHPILSTVSPNEIMAEINNSKEEIEARIGGPVESFAYPRGKHRDCAFQLAIPILKECGIRLAVTTVGGTNSLKISNGGFLKLRRFGISHNDPFDVFKTKVATGCVWQR